jgi:deoxyadenosine/deoxycytidine kinase
MEQDIPLSYLKRLERLYESWIADYTLSEVLILDSEKLDFASDLVDRQDVRARIESLLPSALKRSGQ